MKKVRWQLSIGFVGAVRKGIIELEDDATDEEIDEVVTETVNNYIDFGWDVEE